MNVYLESSAALRELLGGAHAAEIRECLRAADVVATSRLTLAEVGRVLARLRVTDPELSRAVAARESAWQSDSELWVVHPVDQDVLDRCARVMPVEPVRTLDAIHLVSMQRLASAIPELVMLSTDERVRQNARAFGHAVFPPRA